jgi:pyruvate/oxaloacetate carboxyltransferase
MATGGLGVIDTGLSDTCVSPLAATLHSDELLPLAEQLDEVGFSAIETWSPGVFDACLERLDEDPWERLRHLRGAITKTPVRALVDARSLLGERVVAQEVVERFCSRAALHGVEVLRITDTTNSVQAMTHVASAAKRAGIRAEAAVNLSSEVTAAGVVRLAEALAAAGAQALCLFDSVGRLRPYTVSDLVHALRKATDLPVSLHLHGRDGLAEMTCLKGVEAGAGAVDTCIGGADGQNDQPTAEAVAAAFAESPLAPRLIGDALQAAADVANHLVPKQRIESLYRSARDRIRPSRTADEQPLTLEEAHAEIGDLCEGEEDLLTYAMAPSAARAFFERRRLAAPTLLEVAAIAAALTPLLMRTPQVRRRIERSGWKLSGLRRGISGR